MSAGEKIHDRVTLHRGDCLETLAEMKARGQMIHGIVTDPPYHLTSIVNRFGGEGAAPAQFGTDGAYARASRGFMGKVWDGGDIAFRPETWRAMWDVLPPGGHLLAFGGTRTFHRMVCAIEDAGFEVRDVLMWVYGSGFPKSHDVSKGIDRVLGAEREKVRHAPRPESSGTMAGASDTRPWIEASRANGFHEVDGKTAATALAEEWSGWGSALKPAYEPILLARKPLDRSSIAANVLSHGVGGINVDACRIGEERMPEIRSGQARMGTFERTDMVTPERIGRFPANVLHDGSEEVEAAFAAVGDRVSGRPTDARGSGGIWAPGDGVPCGPQYGDTGSASRFFYSAKADEMDRAGSGHPTVKPVALMRWLARMIVPRGGVVLDPFAGSGTTGLAAIAEGMHAILCEAEPEYQADIRKRMAEPGRRPVPVVRAGQKRADLPLFGEEG